MKKGSVIVLFSSIVLFLSTVSAASFGTFPHQIEKESSNLQLEYKIGFINPSSNLVEVSLSADESEEYNVSFSKKEIEVPSTVTSDPSGDGWYYLGNGKYTKTHSTSFQVEISRFREDNKVSIPVRVEASAVDDDTGEGSKARLVQVRNYDYRALIDPSLRPEERKDNSETSWKDKFWREENKVQNEEPGEKENSKNQEVAGQENSETHQNHSNKEEPNSNKSTVNKTTFALIAAIILSVAYIVVKI